MDLVVSELIKNYSLFSFLRGPGTASFPPVL
jgi:hypothetical protein